jgi:hypothetical protein
MTKSKIKMNALERWQKCGELSRAISAALPQHLRSYTLESIFSSGEYDAVITPAIREMYALMLRLQANSYGQNV